MTEQRWDAFRTQLASTLREVTDRVYLIVATTENPRAYVQFTADLESLTAEAPGSDVLTSARESVLSAAGWSAPEPGRDNWFSLLPFPALTAEYDEVAGRCIAALRDAYRIPGPERLAYRAWREPERERPLGRWKQSHPLTLDPGEPELTLAQLGLPSTSGDRA